jgi:hypothetical protein
MRHFIIMANIYFTYFGNPASKAIELKKEREITFRVLVGEGRSIGLHDTEGSEVLIARNQ